MKWNTAKQAIAHINIDLQNLFDPGQLEIDPRQVRCV